MKEKDETGVHDSILFKLFWNQWVLTLGGGGLKVIVKVGRHAKPKAKVLFNPSAIKKVGKNYSMLKEKKLKKRVS